MQISLTVANGSWIATFSGPGSARIVGLFGTAMIPTPYRATALPDKVLAQIARLNPDATVSLSPTARLARDLSLRYAN